MAAARGSVKANSVSACRPAKTRRLAPWPGLTAGESTVLLTDIRRKGGHFAVFGISAALLLALAPPATATAAAPGHAARLGPTQSVHFPARTKSPAPISASKRHELAASLQRINRHPPWTSTRSIAGSPSAAPASPHPGLNAMRLAVANGEARVSRGSWRFWDVQANELGFTTSAPYAWLHYPQLALSSNYPCITANVFQGTASDPDCGHPADCTQLGSVVVRLSLGMLATLPQGQVLTGDG